MVAVFPEGAVKVEPPAAEALGDAAALEVEAWKLAFGGDWIGASDKLQDAVPHVGPEATRGYRGLLLYIAGVWLHLGAQDETQRARARELIREAGLAAHRGTWLKEMLPLPESPEVELAAMDVVAVNEIVACLRGQVRAGTIKAELAEMQADLDHDEAPHYERGLTTLGRYLGAAASKPKGQARGLVDGPDAVAHDVDLSDVRVGVEHRHHLRNERSVNLGEHWSFVFLGEPPMTRGCR